MATVTIPQALAERLHREAEASRWSLSVARLAEALRTSAEHALGDRATSARDLEGYLTGLHLRDLALVSACLDGVDAAWEQVIRDHRAGLYRAADALRQGDGRDLADGLFAELFGVSARGQVKTSLLRYFHGRSSLATWLRAVLAQRHVDAIRVERRLVPLADEAAVADDGGESGTAGPLRAGGRAQHSPQRAAGDAATAAGLAASPERQRWLAAVHRALRGAVDGLDARDRLRLSLYYVESLTLAEIGRGLNEHEATVSRHLSRTRKALRAAAERYLQDVESMSQAEMAECLASVTADAGTLDLAALINAPPEEAR